MLRTSFWVKVDHLLWTIVGVYSHTGLVGPRPVFIFWSQEINLFDNIHRDHLFFCSFVAQELKVEVRKLQQREGDSPTS